jgi:hypothetical protein
MPRKKVEKFKACLLKFIEEDDDIQRAADTAIEINPLNRPNLEQAPPLFDKQELAVLTTKYWGSKGATLGVYFLDNPPADLKERLLWHFNSWGGNVKAVEASKGNAQVRILRGDGDGYWSYLGTDILQIRDKNEPTMNLDSFTMKTSDSEFYRVAAHEWGHTLGFPHEHLRKQIINRLDVNKTIEWFRRTYGWNESMVRSNVLTPLEDSAIIATPVADETSVMTYQLPGAITKDGRPIVGGPRINSTDLEFMQKIYPATVQPPPVEEEELGFLKILLKDKVVEMPKGWTAKNVG